MCSFIQNSMNHIRFRKAIESDSELYYNWVNDPSVREQSYNSDFIEKEQHISWFLEKLNDEKFHFYVFQNQNNQNIGQVRIQEINDSNAIIGVSVDVRHRGFGYGSNMLKCAASEFLKAMPNITINAHIKIENFTSKIIFEKAGFELIGLVEYLNFISYHYIKNAD
jgi:RimJ/RimL family protein N-acetyltransferase